MQIHGLEGMNGEQIHLEIQRGGKFVLYQYCVSVVVLTFKRPSDIFFIREGESAFVKGLPYTVLSLLAGWWGIPWGPIYTIGALITNCGGGKDVTQEVLSSIRGAA